VLDIVFHFPTTADWIALCSSRCLAETGRTCPLAHSFSPKPLPLASASQALALLKKFPSLISEF